MKVCVVGSRNITEVDKARIKEIGKLLQLLGATGSSGYAEGTDTEWDKYIFVQHFLPWNGYNKGQPKFDASILSLNDCPGELLTKAEKIMLDHHPDGDRLTPGAYKLHTRNVFEALGPLLAPETYCDMTIYCAPESTARVVKGGTRTAVEISRSYNIPSYNLRNNKEFHELRAILEQKLEN